MTPYQIAGSVFFLAVATLSLLRIVKLPATVGARWLLAGFRLVLLCLLALAFLEPTVVFTRLPATDPTVSVLVDASASMRLFTPDSSIVPLLTKLRSWNSSSINGRNRFVISAFGDSLRPLPEGASLSLCDHRSFLPSLTSNKSRRGAPAVLLISDGNWSNASLPLDDYADKTVYYIAPSPFSPKPYLHWSIKEFRSELPADSPEVITAALDGYVNASRSVAVSLAAKGSSGITRTLDVPQGHFQKEISLRLRNPGPGRRFYRLEARSAPDSAAGSIALLQTVLPNRFTYGIYNATSTLDRRFLQLALKRCAEFVESEPPRSDSLDLLIVFDWDEKTRVAAARLKPHGVLLFVGCLPCSTRTVIPMPSTRLIRPETVGAEFGFDNADLSRLPPPEKFITENRPFTKSRTTLLAAVFPGAQGAHPDTLDALFTGRWNNRNFIACAAEGLWQWDFLPLAVQPSEEQVFGFSQRLITLTKEGIVNGMADDFLLFPSANFSETDSLAFRLLLPAGLQASADARLTATFSSNAAPPFDTALTVAITGAAQQTIRFKSFPSGRYRLEATLSTAVRKWAFADSFVVDRDNSEYAVQGINATLLQEVGQPLGRFDSAAIATAFFCKNAEMRQPVREMLSFHRNWLLLSLILLFFAAEWITRRILRLD
jgi:hypothetical protein